MALDTDFGQVLNLTSATTPALATSYNASGSTLFYGASANLLGLWVVVTFKSATSLTDIRVKLQGSYDGASMADLQSTRQDNGTTAAEQTFAASAGTTTYYWLQATSHKLAHGGLQVIAKCTGTPGVGDSVTVYAVAG